jgi:hypothetical protein
VGPDRWFAGDIDVVRVYQGALSVDDIHTWPVSDPMHSVGVHLLGADTGPWCFGAPTAIRRR